jgi:hypothetical protein
MILVKKWLPGEPVTTETMTQAIWLEQDYWEKHQRATANGIALVFGAAP